MYSARLDWNLGPGTLTALSNYSTLESHYDEGCAGSAPQDTCRDPEIAHLKQWSQEIRVAGSTEKLNWVGGVYALNIHQDDVMYLFEPYFANTTYAFDSFNNIDQRVTDAAIFGQVDYLFTSHWRGTLGLRATREEKTFSSQTYYNQVGDFAGSYATYIPPLLFYNFSPQTVGALATQTHTDWSGKAEMDYIANKGALIYGSVSRGIKGAGFNSNLTGLTSNQDTPFSEEHVVAYELGEKLTLLGNTLRVNGDVFYYQYHNFQAYQLIAVSPLVTNNDARFSGAEVEANARIAGAWDLHAGGAYLTTTVYDVHTANIGVADQQASDAPKWSGNALVRYNLLFGVNDVYAQWSADYIAGRYHSVDNVPASYIHSSVGHNVRIGYSYDKQWDVSAWCNNVFNAARQTTAYDLTSTAGFAAHTYMPPRWWGVTLRYSFH
jgi:iron complex outermembrane receptor protein